MFWQLWQCHCRKRKKKIVLAIVTMPLPKMEKKNYEICEWVKKKSCHVHNIFTINHTWLIIISSKNLWQINCDNGIAEIREKNQVQLIRCKLKYNILILKWCKQKQKKSTHNSSTIFLLWFWSVVNKNKKKGTQNTSTIFLF